MSNTAEVTPYEDDIGVGPCSAAVAAAAVIAGGVAVARWLSEETESDLQASKRLHARRRDELRSVKSHVLAIKDLEALSGVAARMGYQLDQGAMKSHAGDAMLLRGQDGARLAIERNARGSLTVHSAGGDSRVHALLREHAFEQARNYFSARDMNPTIVRLANGECQLSAREKRPGIGGAAEIKVHLRHDGSSVVDVDCLKGTRCEDLTGQIAKAMGSRVTTRARKGALYQLPGESVNAGVKA